MVNASEEWCGFESQLIKSVSNTGSKIVKKKWDIL